MLNNLWRFGFVSLEDFPSTIFVCPLQFYYFFSSGILITELLSAYSSLVLLSPACHVHAHDPGLCWLWYRSSCCGSKLPPCGTWVGGTAAKAKQSSDNVWGTLDSTIGLWDGENSGNFFLLHLVGCCLLSGLSGLSLSHLTASLTPFAPVSFSVCSIPRLLPHLSPTRWTPLMYIPVKWSDCRFTALLHFLRLACGIFCDVDLPLCLPCSVFCTLRESLCRPLLSEPCVRLCQRLADLTDFCSWLMCLRLSHQLPWLCF